MKRVITMIFLNSNIQ